MGTYPREPQIRLFLRLPMCSINIPAAKADGERWQQWRQKTNVCAWGLADVHTLAFPKHLQQVFGIFMWLYKSWIHSAKKNGIHSTFWILLGRYHPGPWRVPGLGIERTHPSHLPLRTSWAPEKCSVLFQVRCFMKNTLPTVEFTVLLSCRGKTWIHQLNV